VVTAYDKAIVALLTPIAVQFLTKVGLNIDPTISDALTAVITMLVVYLVPNKVAG
jgi:uncharacterized membrane protein